MIHLDLSLQRLPADTKRLLLGYSGGMDSSVLMHALTGFTSRYNIQLWHINHGLQKNAAEMEQFARNQALHFGLQFRVDRLHMDASLGNLEARAREKRYQLFEQALQPGDVLLTAHHQNDQAETLLLNLMRGSGSAGLRAIARQRALGEGLLFRPLLEISRNEIERYALVHRLDWIDDQSNNSLDFDRNYLRHQVLPKILQRWPSAIQQFQRVSELQSETEQLLLDLATLDYAQSVHYKPWTRNACLSVAALTALTGVRQKNLIRYWIKHHNLPVIGFHKLEQLVGQLESKEDAAPCIEGSGFRIRRYQKFLYLLTHRPDPELAASYEMPPVSQLEIAQIGFSQTRSDVFAYLRRADQGQRVTFRFRQENGAITPGLHTHRLKRLFQTHQIPPWIRCSIPQIFLDDELVTLWLL
ncbi:MAG: tRNA lysidine(34) synthetase TilS [Gammaproteobacteria bacterium]|nr:tRNA lysidine(34) synthetase TilS [Gammaproteobacteria bacterium]MBL7000957.1 tRNA lysidine(34) synthetase TilS [Gammaproteobacteria bacterium]